MAQHIKLNGDCFKSFTGSSGTVTFENVPLRNINNKAYHLRVVGETEDGVRTVIRRPVRVGKKTLAT